MSGTLIYQNQALTRRIKELEEENHKLKLQLGAVSHVANYMDQIINDEIDESPVVRKFDAKQP